MTSSSSPRLRSNLSQRQRLPEIMDRPDLAPHLHRRALAGLRRINLVSRSAAAMARPIEELSRRLGRTFLSICDVATGGADVPISLLERLEEVGIHLQLTAIDISSVAVDYARQQAERRGISVDLRQMDVLRDQLPGQFDIVTSSLFLHHLDAKDAVSLLMKMKRATRHLLLLSDLRRTTTGLAAAHVACRIFSRSHVVRVDGPRSVRGAFNPDEMLSICHDAGLHGANLRNCWPFRMLVSWERNNV